MYKYDYEVDGTYGSGMTPCTVLVIEQGWCWWYCVSGSQNVNKTTQKILEGVDVETVEDIDTFTWNEPIETLEELQAAIDA